MRPYNSRSEQGQQRQQIHHLRKVLRPSTPYLHGIYTTFAKVAVAPFGSIVHDRFNSQVEQNYVLI